MRVVDLNVAGAEDGEAITIHHGAPPIVGGGATNYGVACGLVVVDV